MKRQGRGVPWDTGKGTSQTRGEEGQQWSKWRWTYSLRRVFLDSGDNFNMEIKDSKGVWEAQIKRRL